MSDLFRSGMRIHYEVLGNPQARETVAFFNGVMASTNSWCYAVPVFERFGYRILLHDFRGQLLSQKPDEPFGFADHVGDFLALLDHVGIDSVHVVGTSYGGEVGMRLAIDAPDRVKTLSLIDSVSELDPVLELTIEKWIRNTELLDATSFFLSALPELYSADFFETHKGFIDEVLTRSEALPPDFLKGQRSLYEAFLRDVTMTRELKRIRCPTLVICGENDTVKPVRFSEIIAREIPRSEFITIPHCGHVTIYEQPDVLNTALLGFIAKHRAD